MIQNPINALKITVYNAEHTNNTNIRFQKSKNLKTLSFKKANENPFLFYYISNIDNSYFVYFIYFICFSFEYTYMYLYVIHSNADTAQASRQPRVLLRTLESESTHKPTCRGAMVNAGYTAPANGSSAT